MFSRFPIHAAAITLAFLAFFSCSKTPGGKPATAQKASLEDPAKAKAEFGLSVLDAVTCADVKNEQPISPMTEFAPGEGKKVWVHATMQADRDAATTHRYVKRIETLSGDPEFYVPFHAFSLKVGASKSWKLFSYINAYPGTYRVDLLANDKATVMKSLGFTVTGEASSLPAFLATPGDLVVESTQTAEGVKNAAPENPGTVFRAKDGSAKVYLFMKFSKAAAPTTAWLRWSKEVASIDGKTDWTAIYWVPAAVKTSPMTTWYYIGAETGKWKVEVLSADGKKVLAENPFSVVGE
ncbi:MAG: hypothetical protein J0L75_06195 [Spirochaetes bacterium]|nr:hypothetical protein [Spirochaetota bacterium]